MIEVTQQQVNSLINHSSDNIQLIYQSKYDLIKILYFNIFFINTFYILQRINEIFKKSNPLFRF